MSHEKELFTSIEKVVSRYIHSCLFHTSRDFFRKVDRDYHFTKPLDENIDDIHLMINLMVSPVAQVEAQEFLLSAIRELNPMEKRLLYQKFYEEKSDMEIAKNLGLTQQAVSKAKRLLLDKLKSQLEM